DKKRREEIDIRNNADQMVYQTEKTLGELGDKVSEGEKADLTSKLDALKEALKGTDTEAIKAKQDELQKAFYEVSAKLYQQTNAQAGAEGAAAGADAGAAGADYVDADYSEVKDEENK
ncbi:MAG: Hsp70 family protein, partial [Oscillospiraceae bacterium]|nr:Hsp70 family protein [Oscillospiraceae bacterium]